MLVEQDRRSKRQKSNGNKSNECIICGNKTVRKDNKLYRLCETERAEPLLRATEFNMDTVFIKVSIFDKPDDLFTADIMSHKQCVNIGSFISLKLLSITFTTIIKLLRFSTHSISIARNKI